MIIIPCHRCGRQVDSAQVRDGRCVDCRVDVDLAGLRREHARLWRKRERYLTGGASVDSIGRQIARVEDRMAERIVAIVSDERAATEQLRKTLEEARQSRYDIRSLR
jgi:NMD protein affecting ribosome stability and mRNA decay